LQQDDPVVVEFRGHIPSKKNFHRPSKNGGIFQDKKTKIELERLEMQVPGQLRDLKLEHPEVEWHFRYTNAHVDVDGMKTTILDILQKYGVIVNDNIAHFNGRQVIHPAERADFPGATVVLTRRAAAEQPHPRYVRPKKPRVTMASLAYAPPNQADALEEWFDGLEDLQE
jgi:hypothetical protein